MKTKIQILLTACCILSATAQAEWNAPRVVSTGSAAGKPVLVFYANESTAGTISQRAIQSLSSDAGQAEIAERIQEDLKTFQASTDRYIRQIQRAAEVTDLEAVIFTNRLARKGRYQLHRAEAADDQEKSLASFDIPLTARQLDQPLCDADVFRQALNCVAESFDPATHHVVLISYSHGSNKLALTNLVDAKLTNAQTATFGIATQKRGDLGTSRSNNLGISASSKLGTTAKSNLGSMGLVPRLGLSKTAFLAGLRSVPLRYSAVVMFSCDSQLPAKLPLPDHLRVLCTTNVDGIGYNDLSLNQVLTGSPDGMVDRLKAEITDRATLTP